MLTRDGYNMESIAEGDRAATTQAPEMQERQRYLYYTLRGARPREREPEAQNLLK